MVFKSDRQRKAVMAKLKGGTRAGVAPTIITVKREVEVPAVLSISDVKRINKQSGHFFFEEGAMRFFESKVESRGLLINNKFFITSEQFISSTGQSSPRKFTVRELNRKTGGIGTVGEFQQFTTRKQAIDFAEKQ